MSRFGGWIPSPWMIRAKPKVVMRMTTKREIRLAEIRAVTPDDNDSEMIVEGRAVVYDSPAVLYEIDGRKYYEVIQRGALEGADLRDVPFKYNHSDNVMVMARTRNRTLELIPDE